MMCLKKGAAVLLFSIGIIIFVTIALNTDNFSGKCIPLSFLITILPEIATIQKIEDKIQVSWHEPVSRTNYILSYRLVYTINNKSEHEVITNSSSYTLPDTLEMCDVLDVEIWAVGAHGEEIGHFIAETYTEMPTEIIISAILFSHTSSGLLAFWTRPEAIRNCDVRYNVEYRTELIAAETQTHSESVLIPENAFCFHVSIKVRPQIGEILTSYEEATYNSEQAIEGVKIAVSTLDEHMLIVSWPLHSKRDLCSMIYNVTYTSDALDAQIVLTSDTQVMFPFTYCTRAYIAVTILSLHGESYGPTTFLDVTQYPDRIEKIRGLTYVPNPTLTVVMWDEIRIEKCDVTYVVYISSDVGDFTMMTETPSVEILSLYCFVLDVEVYADVRGIAGDSSKIRIVYELTPVQNLEILTSTTENTFTVTWTADENQEQCDIEYMVIYEYGTGLEIRNTSQSKTTFDIINCAPTVVRVISISEDRMSEQRTDIHRSKLPEVRGEDCPSRVVKDFLRGSLKLFDT